MKLDNNQSFKLVTKDNKSSNKGCLIIVIATIIIFGGMISSYSNNKGENQTVRQTYVQEVETVSSTVTTSQNVENSTEEVRISNNPLLNAKVKLIDSDKRYAKLELSSEDFNSITKAQYYEFYNNILLNYSVDYFVIVIDDGTGIYFDNCEKLGIHGAIDENCIIINEMDLLVNGEFISRAEYEATTTSITTKEENSKIELSFGKLLEVNDNGDVVVIKAKYDNLEKLLEKSVQNVYWLVYNNPSAYSEIQFWAVADVNGDTIKVISFTVNSDTINLIANHYIATSDMEANCNLYLEDYYNITQ